MICWNYVKTMWSLRDHHYYERLVGGGANDEPIFDEDENDDMESEEQWLAYIFSISFTTDRTL